jgi:hypothetical protein
MAGTVLDNKVPRITSVSEDMEVAGDEANYTKGVTYYRVFN